MIIAIKDNDRIYLATNISHIGTNIFTTKKSNILEENLNIFKVEDSSYIGGADYSNYFSDMIRYTPKLFKTPLNIDTINAYTLPKLKNKLDSVGKLDDEGTIPYEFIITNSTDAYKVDINGIISKISNIDIVGSGLEEDSLYRTMLNYYKDLSPIDRIKKVFMEDEILTNQKAFPIFIIDSVDKKVIRIDK